MQLNFPATFCCNCGDRDCATEVQDTRLPRLVGGGVDTEFQLAIPVCARCRGSIRRRPSTWATRLAVWLLATAALSLMLLWWSLQANLPGYVAEHLVAWSAALALGLVVPFYLLRRARAPQTSFYQPVRIRAARLRFADGVAELASLTLAFSNADYLAVFTHANRAAIDARTLSAVKI